MRLSEERDGLVAGSCVGGDLGGGGRRLRR